MATKVRKLQLTGGSTYIVSLPSEWIHRNSLGKGSEIYVEEMGDDVLIKMKEGSRAEKRRRVTIPYEIAPDALQRALTSLYIAGFDTLEVTSGKYFRNEIREVIKKFSRLVMGIEIFEESSDSIVLQNVLNSDSFPLEKAIRRMSTNVSVMLSDVGRALSLKDRALFESVIERDDEVDRYHWYIFRESKGQWNPTSSFFLILSRILERVADHAVNISKRFLMYKPMNYEPMEVLNSLYTYCKSTYEDASGAFYSQDFHALNNLIERKGEILKLRDELLKLSSGTSSVHFYSLVSEDVSRIGLYGTDIAELTMDKIISENIDFKL